MTHRLPPSAYVIAVLSLLLLWATHVIGKQQALIDARPAIVDFKTDARTEDVRRGPVKISRTTTVTPDGTKTTTAVREIAAEERHSEVKSESSHKETPAPAARRERTRYVGIGVDPLDYARVPRLRAGVTVFGVLDLGVAYDARFAPTSGAFGLEAAYRF